MTSWSKVRAEVDAACVAAGRSPSEVTVIAVSKTHPAAAVREAMAEGATDFGENYAQEFLEKVEIPVTWHFIGRLQRNKARFVAGKVALVHAVDTVALAEELGKRSPTVQPILLAVNAANEVTKGGVTLSDVPVIADALRGVANVRLDGLMTMPPPEVDPVPHFQAVRELRDRLGLPLLSMGMSGDFAQAIACGATHVRIGTAIFGVRPKA